MPSTSLTADVPPEQPIEYGHFVQDDLALLLEVIPGALNDRSVFQLADDHMNVVIHLESQVMPVQVQDCIIEHAHSLGDIPATKRDDSLVAKEEPLRRTATLNECSTVPVGLKRLADESLAP